MFCRQVSGRVISKSHLLVCLLTGLAAVLPLSGQTVSNFVNLTPCRVIDTRDPGFGAGLGPPAMPAKSTRAFPVVSSSCGIPPGALAYSLNVTVAPHGPMPYLSIWPWGQPQ